jgi:hypothetical protein
MRCPHINFITLCATQFSSSLLEMGDTIRQSKSLVIYIENVCVCVVAHLLGDLFVQDTQNTNKPTLAQKQSLVY